MAYVQILIATDIGAASGVAPLDGNAHVPTTNLGSGTANGLAYLRGDQTWQPLVDTNDQSALALIGADQRALTSYLAASAILPAGIVPTYPVPLSG